MSTFILSLINYLATNFTQLESKLIYLAMFAYLFYGILLAIDAHKRYRTWFMPAIVFLCWLFFSIIFLPIYLITRPGNGAKYKMDEQKEEKAILLGSGLTTCSNCGDILEKSYRYCQKCGTEVSKNCLRCDQIVYLSWKHCVNCGYNLENKQSENVPIKVLSDPNFIPLKKAVIEAQELPGHFHS